jgi:hypothetical protein
VFCYNPIDYAKFGPELSTDDWIRVLQQGRELGLVQLGLSGGEPLMRDDLEIIIAEAGRLGYYTNLITSGIGLTEKPLRDFAWQLARRGFVALAVGSPGGDARLPVLTAGAQCQPLSYLGYVAANAWQALAHLPQVDRQRIGIVGHSYGGKWALFGSCLFEKYACAAWSDPGIVFDETRGSINYQEPWYLGHDPQQTRKPGLVRLDSPRTGAYKTLIEQGHDLHELHVLMAPRPFLVSGGAEDPPKRWTDLHWALKVNQLLGHADRVAMTNRDKHDPNEASNARIYAFFEHWLKR